MNDKKAYIDPKICDGSPFCAVKRVCPVGAVHAKGDVFEVDQSKCIGCGKCVAVCPHAAVKLI